MASIFAPPSLQRRRSTIKGAFCKESQLTMGPAGAQSKQGDQRVSPRRHIAMHHAIGRRLFFL